jgi:hypothetical protein
LAGCDAAGAAGALPSSAAAGLASIAARDNANATCHGVGAVMLCGLHC